MSAQRVCLSICLGSLLLASSPEALASEWIVVNEGQRPVKVTFESEGFIGQRRLAPGEELTLELAPAVYDLLFVERGSSRRVRQRIDLRSQQSLRTRYPFPGPRRTAAAPPLRHGMELLTPRVPWRPRPAAESHFRPRRLHLSLDVFGGVALTAAGSLERVEEDSFLGLGIDSEEETVDELDTPGSSSLSFGVRGEMGYVLGERHGFSIGGAIEWSRFSAAGGPVERFDVDAVSLLLMLRIIANRDAEHPCGRFQAYTGLGLGIYTVDQVLSQVPGGPAPLEESMTVPGFEFRLGASLPLFGPFALFCEYRLSVFGTRVDVGDTSGWFRSGDVYIDRSVITNHLLSGVSLQF